MVKPCQNHGFLFFFSLETYRNEAPNVARSLTTQGCWCQHIALGMQLLLELHVARTLGIQLAIFQLESINFKTLSGLGTRHIWVLIYIYIIIYIRILYLYIIHHILLNVSIAFFRKLQFQALCSLQLGPAPQPGSKEKRWSTAQHQAVENLGLLRSDTHSIQSLYPLVNVYITMERSTIFNGKIHYFYGHFQ